MSTMTEKTPYCIMIEPFMVDELWPKCVPFFEDPEIGDIEFSSIEECYENCRRGIYQLWILMEDDELTGCFMTNIGMASDTVKVVNIFYLSGDGVKTWIAELDKKICEFCVQNDCSFYMCSARKGFSRLVPQLKESGVLYVRDARTGEN